MYRLKKAALFLFPVLILAGSAFAWQGAENSREIIENAYKEASWSDLSLDIREFKAEPQKGFVPMVLYDTASGSGVYYVSQSVEFSLKDIVAMDVFYRPQMEGRKLGVKVYLKKEAAVKLRDYSNKHINGFLGVIISGKLRSVIKISEPIKNNSLNIGEFDSAEALSMLNKFFKPLKPMWEYFRWS